MSRFMDSPEFNENLPEENVGAPGEWFAEDIEKINDPDLRAKEMIAVEKIREQKQDLDAKI